MNLLEQHGQIEELRSVPAFMMKNWTQPLSLPRASSTMLNCYDQRFAPLTSTRNSRVRLHIIVPRTLSFNMFWISSDTLIVWTEPDGTDYALSFQDMEGCSEIWDFIVEVQRHFRGKGASLTTLLISKCRVERSHTLTHARVSPYQHPGQTDPNSSFSSGSGDSQSRLTVASIIASGRLPEPALGIISDLDTAIKAIAKTIHGRERICEYILNEVRPAERLFGRKYVDF